MTDCTIWPGKDPEIIIPATSKSMTYSFLNSVSYAIDLHKTRNVNLNARNFNSL
jgi:hypothetical protein